MFVERSRLQRKQSSYERWSECVYREGCHYYVKAWFLLGEESLLLIHDVRHSDPFATDMKQIVCDIVKESDGTEWAVVVSWSRVGPHPTEWLGQLCEEVSQSMRLRTTRSQLVQ